MASELFTPCPGGASYRVLDDGVTHEVNGKVPVASLQRQQQVLAMWNLYPEFFAESSEKSGVPLPWLVGIAVVETGHLKDPSKGCSPCEPVNCKGRYPGCLQDGCCAFGLMQFIPSTAASYGYSGKDNFFDPHQSILYGGQHMAKLLKTYSGSYPKAATAYNTGSAKCGRGGTFGMGGQNDYAFGAVKASNTFIQMGLGGSFVFPELKRSSAVLPLIAFVAAASGGLLAMKAIMEKWVLK